MYSWGTFRSLIIYNVGLTKLVLRWLKVCQPWWPNSGTMVKIYVEWIGSWWSNIKSMESGEIKCIVSTDARVKPGLNCFRKCKSLAEVQKLQAEVEHHNESGRRTTAVEVHQHLAPSLSYCNHFWAVCQKCLLKKKHQDNHWNHCTPDSRPMNLHTAEELNVIRHGFFWLRVSLCMTFALKMHNSVLFWCSDTSQTAFPWTGTIR